tara:strand:- start:29 stop:796 length:768 start_codon:yes stop_codon:yes gene_type:complete
MKYAIIIAIQLSCFLVNAQQPLINSSMSITSIGIVDSPFGEEVDKIIDGDINTKFLDFEFSDGMGFIVDLNGSSVANYIEIITANDFEVRDPMNFEVSGSNDGTTFTSIYNGEIPCVTDRLFSRIFPFPNNEFYSFYRVNYTNACDPSGGIGIPSIQIAETQLYEETLGLNNSAFLNKIDIFPNPNYGTFYLKYTGKEPLTKALIIDINGRIIKEIKINDFQNQKEIRLNNYKTGIYFLQVSTSYNTANQKVIIY